MKRQNANIATMARSSNKDIGADSHAIAGKPVHFHAVVVAHKLRLRTSIDAETLSSMVVSDPVRICPAHARLAAVNRSSLDHWLVAPAPCFEWLQWWLMQ